MLTTFKSLIYKSPLRQDLVEGVDFVFIRELTGGIYFGKPQGRTEDQNTAYDTCIYTREEIERILKLGFEFAGKRRRKLTVVDKANVLATSRLWREIAQGMIPQYPDVEVEFMFVECGSISDMWTFMNNCANIGVFRMKDLSHNTGLSHNLSIMQIQVSIPLVCLKRLHLLCFVFSDFYVEEGKLDFWF